MTTEVRDLEKGFVSATVRPGSPSRSSFTPNDGINTESKENAPLRLFQQLIGLETPSSLARHGAHTDKGIKVKRWRTRTDNVGLYQRAKQQERANKRKYLYTSYASNTLYLLQILLAATFTALSAYEGTHPVVLTILGAFNTVVAGCLAWSKGQGVPNRYRKARDQYQALVLEIETTERSFIDAEHNTNAKLDPHKESARLQNLFDIARADQQANYPDLYVNTAANAAIHNKDLTTHLEDARADAEQRHKEAMDVIKESLGKLGDKGVALVEGAVHDVVKVQKP